MEDNISTIKNDLEEARQDLQQTTSEVTQKMETVGAQLQPEYIVKQHPLAVTASAAAVGFILGSTGDHPLMPSAFLLGGVLGMLIASRK